MARCLGDSAFQNSRPAACLNSGAQLMSDSSCTIEVDTVLHKCSVPAVALYQRIGLQRTPVGESERRNRTGTELDFWARCLATGGDFAAACAMRSRHGERQPVRLGLIRRKKPFSLNRCTSVEMIARISITCLWLTPRTADSKGNPLQSSSKSRAHRSRTRPWRPQARGAPTARAHARGLHHERQILTGVHSDLQVGDAPGVRIHALGALLQVAPAALHQEDEALAAGMLIAEAATM